MQSVKDKGSVHDMTWLMTNQRARIHDAEAVCALYYLWGISVVDMSPCDAVESVLVKTIVSDEACRYYSNHTTALKPSPTFKTECTPLGGVGICYEIR